ncbi:N-acetylmuramoyl-L-alanine amidase [Antarcticibacterium arcticum]|uniref:N-acetylmuramoyl-L-alanine amidase n=1 Tax=Antarcticibacterium arcticum TaxID=2585771 RepID=A0A5B8YLK0_9FLAO|nr:N-acetylmuramoyl-L-alanine amidase [Antarcticibacterium arcticum]QED38431.1 N-acetylmuramoyl-L-alanine amidase [Antarcticibacterium arcticum]
MKTLRIYLLIVLTSGILVSCSSNPYSKTNRVHKQQTKMYAKQLQEFPPQMDAGAQMLNFGEHQAGTTNFNLRKPNYVIIHHTAQNSTDHTLKTFTLPRTQVSSHYVIGRDGKVYQMLNDYYRAWHAGAGKWGNSSDINSSSIGIELDNNGFEEFSPLQINSLMELLKVLKERHKIPDANFIGHSDIAPSRKVDPNPTFPWKLLAEEGFGLWYEEPAVTPQITIDGRPGGDLSIEVSENELSPNTKIAENSPLEVSPEIALRIIGYDTSNLDAAIKAFKLHFIQTEVNGTLTDYDLRVLNNLYKKYM